MPVPKEDELSYISTVGKELIWLLKTRDGREYYGWHHDSVKSVSEAATIKELIDKQSQPLQLTIKSDKQVYEVVENKCVSDKECINMDCSKCGIPGVKEGYKPYCVEGKCKCMCYGCE